MIKRYPNGFGFRLYNRKLRWKFYSFDDEVAMESNLSRVDLNINRFFYKYPELLSNEKDISKVSSKNSI